MGKYNDNAANRYSYVGEVYNIGERQIKQKTLSELPKEWANLHNQGYIHIHDLDAYGFTYNCLTLNILEDYANKVSQNNTDISNIIAYFEYLKKMFTDLGNEQSGGMALANFDNDTAIILEGVGVQFNATNKEIVRACIKELILWCNNTHTRMGQTSYYVTLNIGLADGEFSRFIAVTLLEEFENLGNLVFKPNIVFKVKQGINSRSTDVNYDIYQKALLITAKKMIPTYLLCDSKSNRHINANNLAIMGCRTRLVDNLYGEKSSIGRGNICNISINLPKIAFEVMRDNSKESDETIAKTFSKKLNKIMSTTKNILIDRYNKTCERKVEDFPTNSSSNLWCEAFSNAREVFKNGTLSIGFIGLSEAVEIMYNKKFYKDDDCYVKAIAIVKQMREYCEILKGEYNLNFSLLATSGELISGRFINLDKMLYLDKFGLFDKGFYTNSFHVDVDSNIDAFRKIELEGVFHEICNGGSITYVELGEAPIGNAEGLQEYIGYAEQNGVHYLGFNFPKDVCNNCGISGIFDECPRCYSQSITRVRRVSGYLEILDGFTNGKKAEIKARREN